METNKKNTTEKKSRQLELDYNFKLEIPLNNKPVVNLVPQNNHTKVIALDFRSNIYRSILNRKME